MLFVLPLDMPYNAQNTMTRPAPVERFRRSLLTIAFWMLAGSLVVPAVLMAQEAQDEEAAPTATAPAKEAVVDPLMAMIAERAALVVKPDPEALARAFQIGHAASSGAGASSAALTNLGDLDGDGFPELVLSLPVKDSEDDGVTTAESSLPPQWNIYLLSWDGGKWKASSLVTNVSDSNLRAISLGPGVGQGIALVTQEGNPPTVWPSVFQVRDHASVLLWDSQSDDSRYESLLNGHAEFEPQENAAADLIVTGRADPGLLQFSPTGRRGFGSRTVYHWDGKAYVPAKPAYTPSPDYTLYRFIAALHLRDFRSAYALIAPASFLGTDDPNLDKFTNFIRDIWPEFVGDNVFRARESPSGAPDNAAFELSSAKKHYLYVPMFSSDGKYLIKKLMRTQEAVPAETP